jgi:DNA-binding transcriptional ArsR family regulator
VTDLIGQVGLSQPLVSWHIGRLRAAGLVTTRRIGRETICAVRPEAFAEFAARQARILGLDGIPLADDGASPRAEAPDDEGLPRRDRAAS